jgi:hypothetical protein
LSPLHQSLRFFAQPASQRANEERSEEAKRSAARPIEARPAQRRLALEHIHD